MVERLVKEGADDALYLFEVPGFDNLIERMRFDQVFHQHAQYFSLHSFLRLLDLVGGNIRSPLQLLRLGRMAVAFGKCGGVAEPKGKLWRLGRSKTATRCFANR